MELEFIIEEKMRRGIEDCRELVDARTAAEYDREWAGEIDTCDFCGEKIQPDMELFADAEIHLDDGVWGILCPYCISMGGNEMVWGRGQLYQYQADRNAWLMVAGFPPEHLR